MYIFYIWLIDTHTHIYIYIYIYIYMYVCVCVCVCVCVWIECVLLKIMSVALKSVIIIPSVPDIVKKIFPLSLLCFYQKVLIQLRI